ncbi:portal protein [Halomonas sp. AOP31-B1-25]|uniref:portal protein n=1 Tax=Halomonas sp. AOP31-B1-25 TaxID=3457694 RepID=UPI004034CEF7
MASLGLLQYKSASDMHAEQAAEAQQMAAEEERRRQLMESSLGAHIRRSWESAKTAKQEVEYRLLDCLRRRKGEYDPNKLAAIRKEGGAEIYMMLTATKCRAAGAWIRDIMMPGNEQPWGLQPTPVADVPDEYIMPVLQQLQQQAMQAQQQGQQVDMAALVEQAREQVRQLAQEKAEEAAERHEDTIADQLAEGGWSDAFEQFVDDFVTYPGAFVRAPILRRVPTLEWLEGWQPVKSTTIRPEFERVSPFDMYPSPDATNVDDGAFIIERARFTRMQLNQLIGVPSFNEESIRRVLEQYGQGGLRDWLWTDGERAELEGRGHEWLTHGETIDGLIYSGGAQGVTLLQWGVNPDDIEDPLAEYEIEAILIGQHVIRVRINRDPLERRPYHKASYQPVPGSFWGQAIPELMADIQDVCNATARSLVNNLAISSGPQVEVYEDRLQPQEDPTNIYPWKIWRTKDSQVTGNNAAVRFYQPSSNAGELLTVYEQFERRADDATNIPRYTYGNENVGGAGQTASGLSMLMESANKGIKDAIRHIDRGVMRRVIEALWLYNMQYSEDPSIKGDCNVVARGSSAMLIREQTHMLRQQFLQMTANEIDMGIVGMEGRRKLLESTAEKLDMPGLIPTQEQMEHNLGEQQQAQQAQLEAQQQIEQAKVQAEVAVKQAQAQKYGADAAETQADTQIAQQMAPLDAQHLLAQIAKLIAETQGRQNERAAVESPVANQQQSGRAAPVGNAQGPARGLSQPPGAMPR